MYFQVRQEENILGILTGHRSLLRELEQDSQEEDRETTGPQCDVWTMDTPHASRGIASILCLSGSSSEGSASPQGSYMRRSRPCLSPKITQPSPLKSMSPEQKEDEVAVVSGISQDLDEADSEGDVETLSDDGCDIGTDCDLSGDESQLASSDEDTMGCGARSKSPHTCVDMRGKSRTHHRTAPKSTREGHQAKLDRTALAGFVCKCRLAREHGRGSCLEQFSMIQLRQAFHETYGVPREQRKKKEVKAALHGLIWALREPRTEMDSLGRTFCVQAWKVGGVVVCKAAFQEAYGVTGSQMRDCTALVMRGRSPAEGVLEKIGKAVADKRKERESSAFVYATNFKDFSFLAASSATTLRDLLVMTTVKLKKFSLL